jgi:hypothetical protein
MHPNKCPFFNTTFLVTVLVIVAGCVGIVVLSGCQTTDPSLNSVTLEQINARLDILEDEQEAPEIKGTEVIKEFEGTGLRTQDFKVSKFPIGLSEVHYALKLSDGKVIPVVLKLEDGYFVWEEEDAMFRELPTLEELRVEKEGN